MWVSYLRKIMRAKRGVYTHPAGVDVKACLSEVVFYLGPRWAKRLAESGLQPVTMPRAVSTTSRCI